MGEFIVEFSALGAFIGGYILIVLVFIIIFIIYKALYMKVRNSKLHFKSYHDLVTLNRDIDVTYSPAVLSYLFNQRLENKKDILATIINLYNKKAIFIKKENDKYKFLPSDDIDVLKLNEDEKYLYDCCILEKEEFSIMKWENIVRSEYDKCGFSNKKRMKILINLINSQQELFQ